ncbi:MAG: FHA domain-containing protein [Cyanobacteriota bacterium]|nr:FHA domain-containing protein [Cyanobacteriota bacterium]
MPQLILEWREGDRIKTQTVRDRQASKNPGTVRLGRDPLRCDVTISDPTVSGLHVEIYFNPQQHQFILRNLRPSNPPLIDGRALPAGEVILGLGSNLQLGQIQITVTSVHRAGINLNTAPTLLFNSPQQALRPPVVNPPQAPQPPIVNSPQVPQPNLPHSHPPAPQPLAYGLQCPNCHRISTYDRIDLGCPWCGTSLAAAASIAIN